MKVIRNIGFLDLRAASEQALKEIKAIKSIGIVVHYDDQRDAMSHINLSNIGTQLSLSRADDVQLITKNGDFKISASFLGELAKPLVIIANGDLTFEPSVTSATAHKIRRIIVNGNVYLPDAFSGDFESIMEINGTVYHYDAQSVLIPNKLELSDIELYGLSEGTRLSVGELIATQPFDALLLKEKVNSIHVFEAMIISHDNLKILAPLIQNYSTIEKTIVPEGHVYFKTLKLDEGNIAHWKEPFVFVHKKLTVTAEASNVLLKVKGIRCNHLEASQHTLDAIMPIVHDAKKITVLGRGALTNMSALEIDEAYLLGVDQLTLSNYGALTFADDITKDSFLSKVKILENYGKITCPSALKPNVLQAIGTNYGVVTSSSVKDKDDDGIIYIENQGSLVL